MKFIFLNDSNIQLFNSFINTHLKRNDELQFDISSGLDIKNEFSFLINDSGTHKGVILGGTRGTTAHISLILVAEEFRNTGLGKVLLTKELELYKNAGIKTVRLEVTPENTEAIKLYQTAGFTSYKNIITYRNHSKTFYTNDIFLQFTLETPNPLMLQPLLTLFKKEETPWIRGYHPMTQLLEDKSVKLVSIKEKTTSGFCIYKTDHFTLQIYDIKIKEEKPELVTFLLNKIVTTEKVVTIRGCYEKSFESGLYENLGFYPESIQQEMRMEIPE